MNFDEQIRSEMKDFHLEDDSPDWNVFEEKLELAEMEANLSFDAQVTENVERYTVSNAVSDWPAMEEKLEVANTLRRRVIGMKLTELFIFIMLIATFFHLRPFDKKQHVTQGNPIVAELVTPELKTGFEAGQASLSIDINENNYQSNSKNIVSNSLTVEPKSTQQDLVLTSNTFEAQSPESGQISTSVVENNPDINDQGEEVTLSNEVELEKRSSASTSIQEIAIINMADLTATNVDLQSRNIEPVVLLNTISLGLNESAKTLAYKTGTTILAKRSENKTWLNVYAGLDVDIVTAPFDPVYDTEAYTQSFTSHRLGASISFYQNNFELETGLNYSEKNFQPGYVVKEISGRSSEEYTETSLQNIEFIMMQIPIHIKYHFTNYKGWHLYGVGGSSLNIIAQANYDIKMKVLSGKPSPNPTPINEPRIHEKDFNGGLFTEGVLASNSYFSLNGGLGIQRNISKRTALFIENSYQHHIFKGGVGPNMNRLNNFSFTTGVKTLIR